MIIKPGLIRRKIRSLALAVFNRIENNNNAVFTTNGEKNFIDDLFVYLGSNIEGEKVFFDVGANVGKFSQMLLDKSRAGSNLQIHVFEPMQASFKILQDKFFANRNVILNRKAVSDAEGRAEIFFDTQTSSLASLSKRNLAAYSLALDKSETVDTMRLDHYIEKHDIKHIHFLKIDIEGHEISAFKGLGNYFNAQFIDFVQFEYGGANLDSHTSLMEMYALFEKADFVVMKIMPRGLEMRSYAPWMDNFQYANYIAVSSRIVPLL